MARFVLAGLARFARGMRRRAARAVGRARLVALRVRARVRVRFTVRVLDRRRPGAALRFLFRFDLDFAIGLSFQFDWLPISIIQSSAYGKSSDGHSQVAGGPPSPVLQVRLDRS